MHYQFLIEDRSSEILINIVMDKLLSDNDKVTYNCKSFRGIGGFTKKNTVKETKTGKLLNDLVTYLRGFNRSLQTIAAAIFVVLDNDERNAADFREQLNDVADKAGISIDYVFCVAVEEIEAWLLGDSAALFTAYPQAKTAVLRNYVQDSICGTWEVLAEAVYQGGYTRMRRECPTYMDIGKVKAEWSGTIGKHMDIDNNVSPSFNSFITEIRRRIPA